MKHISKKNLALFLSILCLTSSLFIGCSTKPVEINYTEVSNHTTKKELIKQLGGKADKKEEKDGLVSYSYTKSKYLDYEGTMTYYLSDDVVTFSRWEYKTNDKDECKKAYNAILSELEKKNKKGTQTKDKTSVTTIWNIDQKTTTLVYTNGKELGNTISIINIDNTEK